MEKENPVVKWFNNIKNTRKNYRKVKSSPYASLVFRNKIVKIIIWPLLAWLVWKGYVIIRDYHANGFMNTVGRVIMFIVFVLIIWRVYKVIPNSKKQLEYYRKYPHVINYCPTNVKEDVDDILEKIKQNQLNSMENKNVQKKGKSSSGKLPASSNAKSS